MSVLVVGVSHRTAPVPILERLALDTAGAAALAGSISTQDHVLEATVLATCNRIEVYADVDRFHGSVESVSRLLCELAGEEAESVVPHLYVHYDDGAVSHLFHVASGLDSMVIGEGQILGQVRDALRLGQDTGHIGASLNALFQQALRVGKRAHSETDIDRVAPSLVSVSLQRASDEIGDLAGRRALVVGAGSMAGLSVATLIRTGVTDVVVANRTRSNADRLAELYGVISADLEALPELVRDADVLISCTGAIGLVLDSPQVAAARASAGGPLAIIDLALPHDIDPAVGEIDGVYLHSLATLADEVNQASLNVGGVRDIVAEEVSAFLTARRTANVTPTVVALRTMATEVVDAELSRLHARLPGLDEAVEKEVVQAVRRVAEKLLHQPTVRVKELANDPEPVSYATALAELFSLDPKAVQAMTRPGQVRP
jgi:glutamyl-tRNA reductase